MLTAHQKPKSSQAGFSLLEILVALAILSVTATLVTVSSISMVESMRERTTLREIVHDIELYRYRALARDKQIIIGADVAANAALLGVSSDWRVQASPSVVFSRHGTCTTGSIELVTPRGQELSYMVVPQTCELQQIEG